MASSPFYFQQPFCQLAEGCLVAELDPPADLAPYVAKLIYVNIYEGYLRQRVPDGCFELGVGINERTGETNSFLLTPNMNWGHWPTRPGFSFLSARFRWGAGARFTRIPQVGSTPEIIPAVDLFGRGWGDEVARVGGEKGAKERMLAFVTALRQIAPEHDPVRADLRRAMHVIERAQPHTTVDDVAFEACLSPSQLRRVFAHEVGASPKELLRLSRVWRAMDLALRRPELKWGDIAAEIGYADQGHLVDEFRHFTGSPPLKWYDNLFGVKPGEKATPWHSRQRHLLIPRYSPLRSGAAFTAR